MVPTPIQNLEEQIARLEARRPGSLLLQDYKRQLADYKAKPGGSLQETYFSGRPLKPTEK